MYRPHQSSRHDQLILPNNSKPRWYRLQFFLRAHGISIVGSGIKRLFRYPAEELPKEAMQEDMWIALISITVHLIPMAGCIVIFFMNFRGYYIGDELAGPSGEEENDFKLAVLQFVAKLHEILMQASLSVTVVSFVRREMFKGNSIAFGAVFGSIQLASIAYLWSREFLGTIRARCKCQWRKWRLIFVIIGGCILFTTVGPSSAIAMRPRLDDFPAGGSKVFLNATRDQIWPSHVDITNTEPGFGRDWPVITHDILNFWPELISNIGSMPQEFSVPSSRSMRTLHTRQTIGIYDEPWTLASTQMSSISASVIDIGTLWIDAAVGHNILKSLPYSQNFRWRKEATWSVKDIYQPVVMATCHAQDKSTSGMENGDNSILVPIIRHKCEGYKVPLTQDLHDTTPIDDIIHHYKDPLAKGPKLKFVELPIEEFADNTIGSFIAFPPSWPGGSAGVNCAIYANWAPSSLEGRRTAVKAVHGRPDFWDWFMKPCNIPGAKHITVSESWANNLNFVTNQSNKTVFEEILEQIPSELESQWTWNAGFVVPLIESILSIMVANGLANTASSAVAQGILKGCTALNCSRSCLDGDGEWCKEIMPKKVFGRGGSVYALPSGTDVSKFSSFEISVVVNGYGYDISTLTLRLACSVLIAYCLFAIAHSCLAIKTRSSSQSWDTVSEIVALAMQSRPTSVLRNTSAGTTTVNIFESPVKIGQIGTEGNHLELIFEEDYHEEPFSPPVAGKLYD